MMKIHRRKSVPSAQYLRCLVIDWGDTMTRRGNEDQFHYYVPLRNGAGSSHHRFN